MTVETITRWFGFLYRKGNFLLIAYDADTREVCDVAAGGYRHDITAPRPAPVNDNRTNLMESPL